ncbi:hypothetical protein [Salicola sp. Rm-C-2C1-2]|uniref:hypothetical protein n=1 Tax=Salicola sp. Rm-C-2C1-2 TaxID=3141321 RepID=UPI0032E47BDF
MCNRLLQAGNRLIARLAGRRKGPIWGCRGLLVLLASLCPAGAALAESPTTIQVAPTDHPRYEQTRRLLSQQFDDVVFRAGSAGVGSDDLVITLGQATLSEIRANSPEQPILALFTESQAIHSIIQSQNQFSAIYSDPPLLRQARLGQLIIPRAGKAAILASPEKAGRYSDLRTRLGKIGLESRVFVIPSQDRLIRHLARALSYGDFLLGTPDPSIFNRQTVKPLLLTSYRSNRLVIGPSRAFVNAGAVASTYTSSRGQIREAVELIRHWRDEGELQSPRYPRTFSVAVNEQVARSMDLLVPSEEELKKTLTRHQEDEP